MLAKLQHDGALRFSGLPPSLPDTLEGSLSRIGGAKRLQIRSCSLHLFPIQALQTPTKGSLLMQIKQGLVLHSVARTDAVLRCLRVTDSAARGYTSCASRSSIQRILSDTPLHRQPARPLQHRVGKIDKRDTRKCHVIYRAPHPNSPTTLSGANRLSGPSSSSGSPADQVVQALPASPAERRNLKGACQPHHRTDPLFGTLSARALVAALRCASRFPNSSCLSRVAIPPACCAVTSHLTASLPKAQTLGGLA